MKNSAYPLFYIQPPHMNCAAPFFKGNIEPPFPMIKNLNQPISKGVHTAIQFCSDFPHKYTTPISITKYVITKN